jgi:hypothetical protein
MVERCIGNHAARLMSIQQSNRYHNRENTRRGNFYDSDDEHNFYRTSNYDSDDYWTNQREKKRKKLIYDARFIIFLF